MSEPEMPPVTLPSAGDGSPDATRVSGSDVFGRGRDKSVRESLTEAISELRATEQPTPGAQPKIETSAGPAHSGIDGAVLAVSELLFLLFGLPFGDALYHDKPLTTQHWSYLAIAVSCAIGGPMWPTIRNRWASPSVATSVANAARDARVWITVLLIFFLYGFAPELYRRAISPAVVNLCWDGKAPPCAEQPPINSNLATTSTPIKIRGPLGSQKFMTAGQLLDIVESLKSQVETTTKELDTTKRQLADVQRSGVQSMFAPIPIEKGAVAWDADSQFLVVTGGGPDATINSVLIQRKSTASVAIKEAYAVSGLTGHRQDLMANVQYKGYYPVNKVDIPPGAPVWLELLWKPPLSVKDFLEQWGKFYLTVVYNDVTYEKEYDENYIRRKLQQHNAGALGPRVTPKDDK